MRDQTETDSSKLGNHRRVTLTRMQRSLLSSHNMFPHSGHQNTPLLLHFASGMEPQQLADAFETVVRKIEALRLAVPREQGNTAIIAAHPPAPTAISQATYEDFEETAMARAARPLDLSTGCYDSEICQHPDGTLTWYLNLHHLIGDGTSARHVLRAVEAAYSGNDIAAQPFGSAADQNPCADGAAQVVWDQRPAAEPLDRLYGFLQRDQANARHGRIALDDALATAWQSGMTGAYRLLTPGLTKTAFLLLCVALYLHRFSGQPKFSVGLVVSQRNRTGETGTIAPVIELFPVDVEIRKDDTFASLHQRLTDALFWTLKHAEPGTAPAPDFDAVVNVLPDEVTLESFAGTDCRVSWLTTGAIDGTHALRMMATPYAPLPGEGRRSAGLPNLVLDLSEAALGDVTVAQASRHMKRVLSAALADPDAAISDFDLISPDERKALAPLAAEPWPQNTDDLSVRLRAMLHGNAKTVLSDARNDISGDDLWRWAVNIAQHLREESETTPARVGICLPPSVEAVAAIYGAVLAGVCFVPMDPSQPTHRVETIQRLAGLTKTFEAKAQVEALRHLSAKEPQAAALPAEQEAYLLFTSGSTGQPKGVPITRAGLGAYLDHAVRSYVPNGAGTVAPLFGTLTFDLTITSLFAPILAGGRVITFDDHPARALSLITASPDINWIKATPSHLALLLKAKDIQCPLKTLIVGGEAFASDLAGRLQEVFPTAWIINEYGPTEAVVGCVTHFVTPQDIAATADIPIGRPIAGTQLKIMDSAANEVPPGAVGELWISHDGVMTGYLGQDGGAILVDYGGRIYYRSGDLVRLNRGGVLEFLGRADEQIKLKGNRIDPAEIEAAAMSHPAVTGAVARIWSPGPRAVRQRCRRCGLPDTVPGSAFDAQGICASCHAYDDVRQEAERWFGTPDDLSQILSNARNRAAGPYDCMHLFSGGKDSTFALYQLVQMGAVPYVVTLDNGYISDTAKANIEQVIADLNLPHEYLETPKMAAIFKESLHRYSNVCNGCYKALYTLATARADALGIKVVITGLSRGQLFETRLVPEQFKVERFDPDRIDDAVLAARAAYHGAADLCSTLPEAQVFKGSDVLNEIAFVDFYRYVDVALDDVLRFLDQKTQWKRPADTGRSTNCLINDAGIFTHIAEQGYHNYAVPYAWDVRLGHKARESAIAELEDDFDPQQIRSQLDQIGYEISPQEHLTLWYVTDGTALPASVLHGFLAGQLAHSALPAAYAIVDEIPLTLNGKVNVKALPQPARQLTPRTDFAARPLDDVERVIIEHWEAVLSIGSIGRDDNFFAIGGDSLAALGVTLAIGKTLGVDIADTHAFTSPTPALLADVLRDLIGKPGAGRALMASDPVPQDPAHAPELNATEMGILMEQRRSPGSCRFNASRVFWVPNQLVAERLIDAAQRTASRHPSLSWGFGTPRGPIAASALLEAHVIGECKDRSDAEEAFARLAQQPFDLVRGPLARLAVAPMAGQNTAILLSIHHIACDHDSFDVFWRQMAQAYAKPDQVPRKVMPPADQAMADAATLANARAYWASAQLSKPGGFKPMPTPMVSPVDGYRTRQLALTTARLKTSQQVSLVARSSLAAHLALEPFVTGGPVGFSLISTRRSVARTSQVIANMLNPLPVQLCLGANLTLGQALSQTNEQLGRTLAHRSLPLPEIVAARRDALLPTGVSPVLLSLIEDAALSFEGAPVASSILPNKDAVEDLTLFVRIAGETVEVAAEYRRSVFSDTVIQTVLGRFARVLEAIHEDGDMPVAELLRSLDSPSVLRGPKAPEGDLLPHVIARHLGHDNRAAAVICGPRLFSWSQLRTRVAALAALFAKQGVKRGDRVAIVLPGSPEFIAAQLAAHVLGAAFVPLDVGNPVTRLAAAIDAADPKLILRGSSIPAELGGVVVDADEIDGNPWPEEMTDIPAVAAESDDIAYVIFTSGTTGIPKGVAISHAQLAASTHARRLAYPDGPNRFAMVSSFGFDSSIVGIFWTLLQGGTVVLPTAQEQGDPRALARMLGASGCSHTLMVPALYDALLDEARRQSLSGWPSSVILAGAPFSAALVHKHFETWRTGSALSNEYGPTEATVWALYHHFSGKEDAVPIGTAVPGGCCAILDENLEICPQGVIGELVLGGPLVADGYLAPDGSGANPFCRASDLSLPFEGRVYRTGDLAVMEDGVARYVGRYDDQLNLGGMRVEPGEIEAALVRLAGVKDAIVVAHDLRSETDLMVQATAGQLRDAFESCGQGDDPRAELVAYLRNVLPSAQQLVAHIQTDRDVSDAALRTHVSDHLPAVLRPTAFVRHAEFPRNVNGKIDRAAPAFAALPVKEPPAAHLPVARPDDEAVVQLTTIFKAELKASRFDAEDNFFSYGGHSLVALRTIMTIEETFDTSLSIADLYDHPTPLGLARHLGLSSGQPEVSGAVSRHDVPAGARGGLVFALQRHGSKPPIIAIHTLGKNGALFRNTAAALGPDQPFWCMGEAKSVNMYGDWVSDPGAATDVKEVERGYAERLEQLVPSGPFVLYGHCLGAVYALELAQQMRDRGRPANLVVMQHDLHAPGLVSRDQDYRERWLRSRIREVRKAGPGGLPRLLGKVPRLAKRLYNETARQIEIAALKRRQRNGSALSHRLAVRQYVERSYHAAHSYAYQPYDFPVLVMRSDGDTSYPRDEGETGWGKLLGDCDIRYLPEPDDLDMVGPQMARIYADVIRSRIDTITAPARTPVPATQEKPPAETQQFVRETPNYRLQVDLLSPGFARTPRPEQREFLVNERLDELARELAYLDVSAPDMISAGGTLTIGNRADAKLRDVEIMEDWQIPLMKEMARIAAQSGGDVLEVGFGRGISADLVQRHKPASHTIIECNPHILRTARNWAARQPDRDIRIIEGLWQDTVNDLGPFDGILFHTYPLSDEELLAGLDQHVTFAEPFFEPAARLLRSGGSFTYFQADPNSVSRAHQRRLLELFASFRIGQINDLAIPEDAADAQWFRDIVTIEARAR